MIFKRKKKQLPPTKRTDFKKRASAKTKAAVDFFNDKKSAVDLLEKTGSRKFNVSPPFRTTNDKFFDFIADKEIGKWLALGLATAFIVVVLYWGIKQ
jgi:hypothetical protein